MGLSSKYTAGIEIEIGGNSTKLKSALDSSNKAIRTTDTELKTLKNSLKLEWNPDNFKRAQELAQRSVQLTTDKAESLKKAMRELEKVGISDSNSEQYENIRRELSYTNVAVQNVRGELDKLNNIRLDKLKAAIKTAGDDLNRVGTGLTMGLTVPLVAAGAASVNYAKDTEESINKVEQVFQYAAEGVKNWSLTTLKSIGLARGTALDMAALYGDMATSMGYNRAEAAKMSMELVTLAADLASFKNISIDVANTALKSIFTGETESLKNLGIVMTEANLKNYALAQGTKVAYTEMDQAQKVALRMQYVLSNTSNAQGDFARTSDGAANQIRIFQESLKEAAATAGEDLLPIITPIISKLSELIQSFGDMDEGTRKLIVNMGLFLAVLGPTFKIVGMGTSIVNAGVTAYYALKAALVAKQAADVGATATQTGLNAAMAANPAGALVTAIGAFVAVLGSLIVTTALTSEHQETLNQKMRESKHAYEESATAIQKESDTTLSLVSALEVTTSAESKTAAQKATILGLVDKLNEAVPTLSLAYDKQTDSLNLTTAAIRAIAQAEMQRVAQAADIDRLTGLYTEQTAVTEELEAAKASLSAAEKQYVEMAGVEQKTAREKMAFEAASGALISAQGNFDRLTAAQTGNMAEIAALEEKYNNLTGAVDGTATATRSAQAVVADFTTVLGAVKDGFSVLAKAQKEMDDNSYLSIETVETLIGKYPELTGYIVETASGYKLADGAVAHYMATQKAGYQMAYDNAASAANTIIKAEIAKGTQIDNTTNSVKGQILALAKLYDAKASVAAFGADYKNNDDYYNNVGAMFGSDDWNKAQEYYKTLKEITAAEKDLASFNRVSTSLDRDTFKSSGSTAAKNSDKAATAATKEREDALKKQRDKEFSDLKYFLDAGLITEQDYYKKLAELRDKHFAVDTDEWRKYAIDIKGYNDRLCKDKLDSVKASAAEQTKTMKDAYDQQLADAKRAYDQNVAAARDAYNAQRDAARAAYDQKKAIIDRELDLEREKTNTIIDGIDKEIAARKNAREDEDQDAVIAKAKKRLEAATAQLSFARTDEDKTQWENEVKRLESALADAIKTKTDTEWERGKEQEKEAAKDKLEAAEKAADTEKQAAEAAYNAGLAQIESQYKAKLAQLEASYQANVARMQAEYERKEAESKRRWDEIQQMILDVQKNNAQNAGIKPKSIAGKLSGVVGSAGRTINQNTQSISNSANLTINQASSLTQGQIAGAVRKVLNEMGR